MILSPPQALAVLESPAASAALLRARRVEERLRLHVDEVATTGDLSPAWGDLCGRMKELLPADKYTRFLQFVRLPLPTVKVTGRIFDALHRLFEASNSRLEFTFQDPALGEDFDAYRQKIGDETFWLTTAYEAYKTMPHALVVVDVPAEQGAAERPEPYYYLVPTSAIIDVRHRPDGQGCEHAAFWTGANTAAVFDEATWRTFRRGEDGKWTQTNEVAHGLGYCPARALCPTVAVASDPISRRSPLTPILGDLDGHVMWSASTDYFRSYGAWPPMWKFKEECSYRDEGGNMCVGGYVNYPLDRRDASGVIVETDYRQKPCPACERNRLIGPGTVVEVPLPIAGSDTREPIGMLIADADALRLAYDKLDGEENDLFVDVAGETAEASATAINEKQVRAGIEARRDVLLKEATKFEGIHTWALTAVAHLRYGAPLLLRGVVDYGDEFHLTSESELVDAIVKQQEAGLPAYVISSTRARLLETAYRLDPGQREKAALLAQLEPYPDFKLTDLTALASAVAGSVDPELLAIKLNFSYLIHRFERENGDIRRFASVGVSVPRKVSIILNTLQGYVRESIRAADPGRAPA